MVLAQEAFTSLLIVTDQNGNVATGKTISYRIFDENLVLFASGNMSEIAGSYGIYYKTWTPDADGYWIFEAYYVGSDFKFYDIEMYQVGKGVEDAIFERIGAPAFSTIAGDIANLITRTKGLDDIHDDLVTVLADTNELQTDWTNGGRLDLIIDAILADTGELQTDWANGGRLDTILDNLTTNLANVDQNIDDLKDALIAFEGTTTDTGADPSKIVDSALTEGDDYWNGAMVVIVDGVCAGQQREITDFDSANDEITVSPNFDNVIVTGVEYKIIHIRSAEAAIAVIDTVVDAILVDTNELQTDWTNGGRLDLILDAILADTANLDNLIQTSSTVNGAGGTVDKFDTNLAEATDDHYKGLIIMFTSGNLAGQSRLIIEYDGTTKEITVHPSLTEAPADTDAFSIFTGGYQGTLLWGSKGLHQIYDLIDQLFNLNRVGDTITTDGNEQTLWINDNPDFPFRPTKLLIDTTAHTATEFVTVRAYYRLKEGGNYIEFDEWIFGGVQDPLGVSIDLLPNTFGVKLTIEKTAGTNRDYDYEVYFEEK